MSVDTKDRVKIQDRTKQVPPDKQPYDYRLHLGNEPTDGKFSFLAVGDSGSGGSESTMKQRVADSMANESLDSSVKFVLHLGDVVYLSGSKEGYKDRFIKPYRKWLVRGENHKYNDMVFRFPVLPVYGNHDYYDMRNFADAIPFIGDALGDFAAKVSDDIGSGSDSGLVFEQAFVEPDLARVKDGGLPYVVGDHTRIPNRYYWFTYGPCAFFALDSNTLDQVQSPNPTEMDDRRDELDAARSQVKMLQKRARQLEEAIRDGRAPKGLVNPRLQLLQLLEEIAEWDKRIVILEKYLDANPRDHDAQQIEWLKGVLRHPDVQGKFKVVYLHHPLYTSEETHTADLESDGVRENLRSIFIEGQVNLVISGHAHCFEWVSPRPSDANLSKKEREICYIVSGGGGRHLRNSVADQRLYSGGSVDTEMLSKLLRFTSLAESRAYAAEHDPNTQVFHYLRVDVTPADITVRPVGVVRQRMADSSFQIFRETPMRVMQHRLENRQLFIAPTSLEHIKVRKGEAPESDNPML